MNYNLLHKDLEFMSMVICVKTTMSFITCSTALSSLPFPPHLSPRHLPKQPRINSTNEDLNSFLLITQSEGLALASWFISESREGL